MIPHRLIAYGLAILVIFLGGMGAGSALRNLDAKAELAKCQKTNAETIATLLRAAQEAEASYRKREAQINALQTEALDAALFQAKQAQDDASRVRALLDRMRKQATSSGGSQPSSNPPAVSASEATGTTGSVQADMLIGLGETAAILAEYADKARIAGMKCQADYEAIWRTMKDSASP